MLLNEWTIIKLYLFFILTEICNRWAALYFAQLNMLDYGKREKPRWKTVTIVSENTYLVLKMYRWIIAHFVHFIDTRKAPFDSIGPICSFFNSQFDGTFIITSINKVDDNSTSRTFFFLLFGMKSRAVNNNYRSFLSFFISVWNIWGVVQISLNEAEIFAVFHSVLFLIWRFDVSSRLK